MLDFERFYLNTKNIVYQYLYYHVRDYFELEDIAQETYVMALEQWDMLKEHPNPAGWLMLTTKYICAGYHRHVYNRMESLDNYKDIGYEEPAYNMLVMEDLLESVYNKKESILAKRYFLNGDSISQLSSELGMSEGAFRTRLYRMKRRLKSYVESGKKVW